ncbi:MAG TPA: suppressor of fused domain protein [Kofleriaceae bacterium]|jgi:hypothetical protein
MGWFGKKKPETVTHTQTFELRHPPRPVNMDVVEAIDNRLAKVGRTEVMHAIDPGRLASFADGGPPVWSVAMTQVQGRVPYTLFTTYGFSWAVCPEPGRDGVTYEFSLAVVGESHPWAVALLRHLCRYQRNSGNELMVGDVMPCRAPLTYIPFPPEHHAMMPPTKNDSLLVVDDPLLAGFVTSHGAVEFRRICGMTEQQLAAIGPIPSGQRQAAWAQSNPELLTFL